MAQFGDGVWKEGRAGAASLVYVGLSDAQLAQVTEHHAAVYIRATLACATVSEQLTPLVQRNWDLAMRGDRADEQLASDMRKLDGRDVHGVIEVGDRNASATFLYRVGNAPETIRTPQPALDRALGSFGLPTDLDQAKRAIDVPVFAGEWAIWRIDAAIFDALTADAHKRLLQWLGDDHGRIWCAPVRDIATWRA